jgi:DNA polymerase-3 subunit alpha
MKAFGITLLPPDVNSSDEGFTPRKNAILFGLAAIKGLGASAVQMILKAREEGGEFKSIFNFAERVDPRAVNKRVMESLIKAGAFDATSSNRAAMLAALDRAIEHGAKVQRDRLSGQTDLFASLMGTTNAVLDEPPLPEISPWTRKESLAYEKEALGFYASGHPLEDYADSIRAMAKADSSTIAELETGETVSMGGIILDLATKTTKKGDRFALFRLEDQFGAVKILCWPEQYNRHKSLLQNDEAVVVRGRLESNDESGATIVAHEIALLESAKAKAARALVIRMNEMSASPQNLKHLSNLLSSNTGATQVYLEVMTNNGWAVRLQPNQFFRVVPSSGFIEEVEKVDTSWKVELVMGESQIEV